MTTDFEQRILNELNELKSAVNSLRSDFSISQITYFENLSPFAVVGVDYVAYRFNCSQSAVIRGRFETNLIPKLRQKPIAFIKREVDVIWQNLNISVEEKAAKIRQAKTKIKNK